MTFHLLNPKTGEIHHPVDPPEDPIGFIRLTPEEAKSLRRSSKARRLKWAARRLEKDPQLSEPGSSGISL